MLTTVLWTPHPKPMRHFKAIMPISWMRRQRLGFGVFPGPRKQQSQTFDPRRSQERLLSAVTLYSSQAKSKPPSSRLVGPFIPRRVPPHPLPPCLWP